mmetsp:Transcript_26306/g.55528  ORF Transcript_26306/g.55528 Transcript_26306/m.55528 type:complete len:307 (+) Transcript_26306:853-1773(+)
MNELRFRLASARDSQVGPHSACLALLLAQDFAGDAPSALFGDALGGIGQTFRVEHIVRSIDNVLGQRHTLGKIRSLGNGRRRLRRNLPLAEKLNGLHVLRLQLHLLSGTVTIVRVQIRMKRGRKVRQCRVPPDPRGQQNTGRSHLLLIVTRRGDGPSRFHEGGGFHALFGILGAESEEDVSLRLAVDDDARCRGHGPGGTSVLEGFGVFRGEVGERTAEGLIELLGLSGEDDGVHFLLFVVLRFLLRFVFVLGRCKDADDDQIGIVHGTIRRGDGGECSLRGGRPGHGLAVFVKGPCFEGTFGRHV